MYAICVKTRKEIKSGIRIMLIFAKLYLQIMR